MQVVTRSHALPFAAPPLAVMAAFALLLVAIPHPTRAQIVGET